jgi:DNA polymerase II small subunit/DNA polymerase delta subunit B
MPDEREKEIDEILHLMKDWQSRLTTLLLEVRDDVSVLNDRLDRLEKMLAEREAAPPRGAPHQ